MQLVLQFLSYLLFLTACRAKQVPILADGAGISHNVPAKSESSGGSELLDLHRKLVEIESISGNEKNVGDWLASYLSEHGLEVEKQYLTKDRFNVLAYLGKQRETKLLVTSHIDTVPPFIPYSFHPSTSEIWGRGTVDAKACVAAQTIAALNLFGSSSPPSLALLFVVGEEVAGDGMLHFSSHAPTNYTAVLFGEPTEEKLVSGHKGMLSFRLNVTGRAAHSGYPWLGLSANAIMVEALGRLLQLESALPHSEKFGPTTLNVGRIEGGVAGNVVAESATAEVSVRLAGGTPALVKRQVFSTLASIKERTFEAGGHLSIQWSERAYGPVNIDTDIPGFDTTTVNYGTDVPNFIGPHKRYLYGPGSIMVAHGPQEHLTVKELEASVGAYEKIIRTLAERG